MQVEQLAAESGVSVDTIRYYQKIGLLHSPQRNGRVAEYDQSHIARLGEIRSLSAKGFTLAQIGQLSESETYSDSDSEPLLAALNNQTSLTLAELAQASGLEQSVCEIAVAAGLITPISGVVGGDASGGGADGAGSAGETDGETASPRFSPSAAEMLKVGLQLLEAGIPLEDLLDLAAFHASNIERVAESAVSLFDKHLLPDDQGDAPDGDPGSALDEDLGELVSRLVPLITNLVAQHFQRTLIAKATERLHKTQQPIRLRRSKVGDLDPLLIYAIATAGSPTSPHGDSCAYWATPNDDLEIAAIGSAATLTATQHKVRFADIDVALQNLDVVIEGEAGPPTTGPLLLGGFRFAAPASPAPASPPSHSTDPDGTNAKPDWAAFGAGDLTLPEILVVRTGGETYVTAELAALERSQQLVAEALEIQSRADGADLDDYLAELADRDKQERLNGESGSTSNSSAPAGNTDGSTDADYLSLVDQAMAGINNGLFTKVVTARLTQQPCSVSPPVLLNRLRHRYGSCAIFAFTRVSQHLANQPGTNQPGTNQPGTNQTAAAQTFLGASPELLIRLEGTNVNTEALAGSRPRSTEPTQDAALTDELVTSDKERAEHRAVALGIREALTQAGVKLAPPTEPTVRTLPAIQHLHTPIDGGAQTNTRVLDLVAALHPTAAVAGTPTAAALDWIARHETFDRGWYAGPIGWTTLAGSGDFRVALRCALLSDATMTLFAGGGIVAGTEPTAELAETNTKFEALLSVAQPELSGS